MRTRNRRPARVWLRLLAVVAAAAIFVAGCGSDDDAEPEPPTTTSAPAPSAAPTVPPTTTTAPPTTTSAPPPAAEPLDENEPVSIAAGTRHTCAAYASGSVACWGENENGQLGNGESGHNVYSSVPVEVAGIDDAVAVGVGWEHSCAVHDTGEVSCWGDNSHGEIGSGQDGATTIPLPAKAVGIDDAVSVTAGHWHTCALRQTGGISCWGADHDGQLGDGRIGGDIDSFVPVDVIDISDAVGVSAGGEHTCAVHATGEVSCWGDNWKGELGNGTAGNEFDTGVPVKVSDISDAVTVSSGDWHTCAVRESGNISCWGGDNWNGELGNGQSWGITPETLGISPPRVPVEVVTVNDAIAVSAGSAFTCALREGGKVSCWGGNYFGQLGASPDTVFASPIPLEIPDISDATVITAGVGHTCAVRSGEAYCWGRNIHGQLGNGMDSGVSFEKVQTPGIDDAIDVSATTRHTCATHATGEVSCWGTTWRGGTGDIAAEDASLPVKIDGISTATSVSASPGITCATLEGGEASCWGFFWNNDFVTSDDGDVSPVPAKWRDTRQDFTDITSLETGDNHACALHADGTITCAGANWYGNIGNGEFGDIDWTPTRVVGIDDAVGLSLGFYHTCAVHATGEVSCWGRNEDGQLGNGTEGLETNSAVPVKVSGITDATAVSTTYLSLTCALHETGEVSCWGSNLRGELGSDESVGGAHSPIDHSAVPVKIKGITDAAAVSAGASHACVLHETGEISCWGSNSAGELGADDHIPDDQSAAPLKVTGITDATAVSASDHHTCALRESGEVTCWGWNEHGQLGNGEIWESNDSFEPVKVSATVTTEPPASDEPVDVSAGVRHNCMVWISGKVSCWGDNNKGQLGDGEFGKDLYSSVPMEVENITDAVAVGAGWEHTCAVHATGEVSCWGDDTNGELGNGEIVDQVPLPVKAEGITDATAVAVGHWHTCALHESGEVSCWGRNYDGQLGNGEMGDASSAVPVSVLDITDAVAISAGGEHTCAVHATGEVSCWGDNFGGELGTGQRGNEFDSAVPVKVAGIEDAIDVSTNALNTCVLREGGNMSCWGDNTYGQLGDGTSTFISPGEPFVSSPVNVSGIDSAIIISTGADFSCAALQSGQVRCWGNNASRQLGNPAGEAFSLTPMPVADVDDAVSVSAGTAHACVLRESGEVSCWGSNFHGRLGSASGGEVSTAQVQVLGVSDAIDVAASVTHTCAAHATGEVSCWGQNWKGPAGDASPLPVKVSEVADATAVSTSAGLSCATLEEGEAACWGLYWGSQSATLDNGDLSPLAAMWANLPGADPDAADIALVASGGSHACALHTDGTIRCAGANWNGNLGTGQIGTNISWTPQKVVDVEDATDIALGFAHTCALHATGEVSCWGRNHYGQLGTGEENVGSNSPSPQQVVGITDAIAIEAGAQATTCALHESGEVSCWGVDTFGTLGANANPSSDHSAVPVRIQGITDATAVAVGFQHVCALLSTNSISCWGDDSLGQLGAAESIQDGHSATPVTVSGIDDATAVSAGTFHTCAVHTSGQVTCWGWDENGQLGDGEAFADTGSASPVTVFGT